MAKKSIPEDWHEPDEETLRPALTVLKGIARFHRHRVLNIEAIPQDGPCLLVVNHSLATYDISLLGLKIYEHNRRFIRSDRAIFKPPSSVRWRTSLVSLRVRLSMPRNYL